MQTLRRIVRTPMFAITTVLTLALVIGANTAIFSIIETVLLKPLPYPEQDRLVAVLQTAPGVGIKDLNTSAASYFNFREENTTFSEIALWESGFETVTGLAEPERVETLSVTAHLPPVLGIEPTLGHAFTDQDDAPGAPDQVLLSYNYWQRKFGGDRSVLGKRINAGGVARDIIGVLPPQFWLMDQTPDLVFALKLDRNKATMGGFHYHAIARLKPGVTLAQANADVGRMLPLERKKFPVMAGMTLQMFDDARFAPNVQPLKQHAIGDIGQTLWLIMASVGLLLAIACANVGNLMLVRAEGRQQELAVRAALGAGWRQITRELLLECVILSIIGGTLGLTLADTALRYLVTLPTVRLPRLEQLTIDGTVLLFTFGVSLFSGVLFAIIPAIRYASPSLANSLRGTSRTSSHGRDRQRTRNVLVVVQVGLALVLLIGSGLMIRTFEAMRRVQPGFTITNTLQTALLMTVGDQKPGQELLERLAAIPGVQSASIGTALPMTNNKARDLIVAEDHPYQDGKLPPLRRFTSVAPGFFQTMGIPLVAGRDLTWVDIDQLRPVVVISENFAREYWNTPSAALGKRIQDPAGRQDGQRWNEIVGVVGDVRQDGADQPAPSFVYWPLVAPTSAHIVLRSDRAGSQSFIKEIRKAVSEVNPNWPIEEVRTMGDIYRQSMARTSFTLVMLLIAGSMALLLGVVGIYAVISYSVSQRTREMGIRIALGATQSELKMMFVRHGFLLGVIGVATGLAVALGLSRVTAAMLFEISPLDPVTYVAVSLALLAAVVLASYLPALKASAVDPAEALRAEQN